MNLTAYSDSESDGEAPSLPKPSTLRQAPKPTFQKVVDRSNPGRIKVSLSGAVPKDDIQDDAPPAKKPRLGGGGLGGFNAMLPAPKKPAASASVSASSTTGGKRGLGKGLASGVNLKTGAEPAFKRESKVEAEEYDENGNQIKKEPLNKEDFRAMLNLPLPKTEPNREQNLETRAEQPPTIVQEPQEPPKPIAPRFVPMSVGKGKKKKPLPARPGSSSVGGTSASGKAQPPSQPSLSPAEPVRKPKVSLFGTSTGADAPAKTSGPHETPGEYQPLLHGTDEEDDAPVPDKHFAQTTQQFTQLAPSLPSQNAPHDLSNIATELNLSEAERRQLFGKRGKGDANFSGARIVEFNTDTEYAHNEHLRQQGEQVQHNALKSISGTGKNSLKSLVSAATTQKDALEDHFAAGHRNKREAGNRYGW